MRGPKLLPIAAVLMAALSASAASATMPPDDEPEASDGKKGGNAIDKSTETGTGTSMTGAGSLPPEGYTIIGDFLALVSAGDVWGATELVRDAGGPPQDDPSTFGYLAPIDGPAESILDQIDESQASLPMVGEAGSEGTVAGAQPTPPESTLDHLDAAPAPAASQDAAKPAANQALRPAPAPPP